MADVPPSDPKTPKRILIIYNPTAGWFRRRRFQKVRDELRRLGCDLTVQETGRRGDAEAFSRAAVARDVDAVVAAGGDGTINEVASGLIGGNLPLGIIPLGTTNVLAREIGLFQRPEIVAATIAEGTTLRCYPGRANGRLFLMMAGVGLDAHAVQNVSPVLKTFLGKGAYVIAGIASLWSHSSHLYDVTLNDRTFAAASVIIGKGRYYAGGFVCTPDARLDRASFQVCLFERGGRFATLRYILSVVAGSHGRRTDVTLIDADRVRIEGGAGDPVQADGDIVTCLPLEAEVSGQTLDLIVPPQGASTA